MTRRISAARGVLYILAQCAGALAGAGLLYLLTPGDVRGNIGLTTINETMTVEQAFGIEFFITFVLVFTVFSAVDISHKDHKGQLPLTVGLSVTLCHLFAVSCRIYFAKISTIFLLYIDTECRFSDMNICQ